MRLSISTAVLEKYPDCEMGFLVAEVQVQPSCLIVEAMKKELAQFLHQKGIDATNFAAHPSIEPWRGIYEKDFRVKAKTYRSSLEALVRRVATGKGIWNINTIVDLYNCCSVFSLLPMGAYDLSKIKGDISIRYAKPQEPFQALGEKTPIITEPHHIVYADDAQLLCWLWNHKDAAASCIDSATQHAIFFIDSAWPQPHMQQALDTLSDKLHELNCTPQTQGILSRTKSVTEC